MPTTVTRPRPPAAESTPDAARPARRRRAPGGPPRPGRVDLEVAEVVAVDAEGAVVRLHDGAAARLARAHALVDLAEADVGREVAVQFERGDPARPVVLGVLRRPAGSAPHRLVVEAPGELVLRSGTASITLGPRGRVVVRGDHVVSRSTGVNRVNGASVQIN